MDKKKVTLKLRKSKTAELEEKKRKDDEMKIEVSKWKIVNFELEGDVNLGYVLNSVLFGILAGTWLFYLNFI